MVNSVNGNTAIASVKPPEKKQALQKAAIGSTPAGSTPTASPPKFESSSNDKSVGAKPTEATQGTAAKAMSTNIGPASIFGYAAFRDGEHHTALTELDKLIVKQLTGQEAGSAISYEGMKTFANAYDKFDKDQSGDINANEIRSVLTKDNNRLTPEEQKNAILLMTNPNLLNKLDGADKNGLITKEAFTGQVANVDSHNAFGDALQVFDQFGYVLDNMEKTGKAGNNAFGFGAFLDISEQSANSRTWDDVGLSNVSLADREHLINAAKVVWAEGNKNDSALRKSATDGDDVFGRRGEGGGGIEELVAWTRGDVGIHDFS